MRDKQINLRLNATELARFRALAEYHGVSVAEVLRKIVDTEFHEVAADEARHGRAFPGVTHA